MYPFWRALLETLGLAVVVSEPTSREVVELGSRQAVDEACFPVKAYYGHVASLRDKVDAVFAPRLVSLVKGTYTCPKLLGLPDMIRHNVRGLPSVIVADIDASRSGRDLYAAAVHLGRRLGRTPAHAARAAKAGLVALDLFREALRSGRSFASAVHLADRDGPGTVPRVGPSAAARDGLENVGHRGPEGICVAVVGHAYNLFDPGLNLDLRRRLTALGCWVLTSEMLSDEEVRRESMIMAKEIFWSSGRKILSAVRRFRAESRVDGIIHVLSFGCGPDSMVGEMAERETRRQSRVPYMALTIDEHTAEAGLVTRLEAYVDMIRSRKRASLGVNA